MSNNLEEFPSLNFSHTAPCGWIQWKGTNVCVDIECVCGGSFHFDGDFMYHVLCPKCERVYECDGHIKLHELKFKPENTILLEANDVEDK